MRPAAALAAAALAALAPAPARAHHGVAAVGVAGPEGPGAALETTSALPLPEGRLFAMLKSEYVPYQRFASAAPTDKAYASFNTVALGYGVRPWLSAYVFQPVNVKEQDGAGRNVGAGIRASLGPVTVALGARRAALKALNEQAAQQGSEGLEVVRAALTVGYATRL